MSTTVDNRVVEMQFDNQNFESNVGTTLNTLGKLASALNLPGASKGLQDISAAAERCDISPLGRAVDTVASRFSALDAVAFTVLQNITNSVLNTGRKIVNTFAIEPITTGFNEYELKMGSIQTIMASTGESLETVNKYLNELNKYSDDTIYSFSDMTTNIGKFTNAGVKLEDAVAAIKGISNEAAVSGANANEASRAMYNFAQALSAGYVKLIDWKSIENANMATVEFKNNLLETAVECGTVRKNADGMYTVLTKNLNGGTMKESINATHNFNESLNQQWMTTEVLTKTLAKYADANTEIGKKAYAAAQDIKTFSMMVDTLKEAAQSGWAQTWEIIFGDFEEAKSLWTEIGGVLGDVIQKQADSRNGLFQSWKDLGGREAVIESLRNAFEGLVSILKPINEAFHEIIPPLTGQHLADLSKKLEEITGKFKLSEQASSDLKSTFRGLFSIVDIIRRAFVSLTQTISPATNLIGDLAGHILHATGVFGEYIAKIDKYIADTDIFNKAVSKIISTLKELWDYSKEKISDFGLPDFETILDKVKNHLDTIVGSIKNFKDGLSGIFDSLSNTSSGANFFDGLFKVFKGISKLGEGVVIVLKSIFDAFNKITNSASFSTLLDIISHIVGISVGFKIIDFLKSFGGVLDILESFQLRLKADALQKIAIAIAILAGSLLIMSMIDSDKLAESTAAMSILMGELTAVTKFLSGTTIGKHKGGDVTTSVIKLAGSLLILSIAMKKLSDIDPDRMADSLFAISVLLWELVGVASTLSGAKGKRMMKGATQLVILAAALEILADVCRRLSEMSWEELQRGLTGIGILLTELSAFMNTAKFGKMSIFTATGLVILSAALKILYGVAKDFASMKPEEMERGFTAIGFMLGYLATFITVTSNAKHVLKTSVAMVILSAALKILYSAFSDFASMDYDSIGRGLTAMGLALAVVVGSVQALPNPAKTLASSLGLIMIGTAIKILASAFQDLAKINPTNIGNGLMAMGGMLGEIAISMMLMQRAIPGAIALTIVAGALAILTPELMLLGSMSTESIVKALIALGGAFTVIGVAGLLLKPIVPTIIMLSVALGLLGVAIIAIGAGMNLLGLGFSAIAVGITALAAAVVAGSAGIITGISAIVLGLAGLIPEIAIKLAEGIIAFVETIGDGAETIYEAIKNIVLGLVDVLVECAPDIATGALEMLLAILDALVEYVPQIVTKLVDLLIAVFDALADRIPDLVVSAMNFFAKLFGAIIDELSGIDYESMMGSIKIIGILTALTFAFAALLPMIPAALGGVLGFGAVVAELSLVLAAVGALAQIPGLQWLIDESSGFLQSVGNAIGSFIGGIIGGAAEGITASLPNIATDLSTFMTNLEPFISGIKEIDPSALQSAETLVDIILKITAANLIEGITRFITGGASFSDFGAELVAFGESFAEYANSISGVTNFDAVSASAAAAGSLSELAQGLANSGGLVSLFTGDNTLADFAAQLADFGPSFAKYAESVAEVDPAVVIISAAAAKSLVALANSVPDRGGLFSSEATLSDFGYQLSLFGPYFAKYADSISGVDMTAVLMSANAAKIIASFASSDLPDGSTLKTFGTSLDEFGTSYKRFCEKMETMKLQSMAAVIVNVKQLSGIAKELASVDVSSFSQFSDAVNKLGNLGGKDFSAGIKSTAADVKKAVSAMMSGFLATVKQYSPQISATFSNTMDSMVKTASQKQAQFKSAGTSLMSQFAIGFKSNQQQLSSSVTTTMSVMLRSINSHSSKFKMVGVTISRSLVNGWKSGQSQLTTSVSSMLLTMINTAKRYSNGFYSAGQEFANNLREGMSSVSLANVFGSVISSAVNNVRDRRTEFYNAGKYLVEGFKKGITDYTYLARDAAKSLGIKTANSLKNAVEEQSPSKLTYRYGMYFTQGFSNGISEYSHLALSASEDLGDASVKALSNTLGTLGDMVDSGLDVDPTIRPVLDLSNVQAGLGKIDGMINADRSINLGYSGIITGRLSDTTNAISQQEQLTVLRRISTMMDTYFPQFSENDIYLDTGAIAGSVNRKLGLQH